MWGVPVAASSWRTEAAVSFPHLAQLPLWDLGLEGGLMVPCAIPCFPCSVPSPFQDPQCRKATFSTLLCLFWSPLHHALLLLHNGCQGKRNDFVV